MPRKVQTDPSTALAISADLQTINLMKAALGGKEIKLEEIPATATLEAVTESLMIGVTAFKRLADAQSRLQPIIGRILLHIAEHKLWKGKYRNMTDFMQKAVVDQMGMGRSSMMDALRVARQFPGLTVDEYQAFGARRLLIASKRIQREDTPVMEYGKILDWTKTKTVAELETELRETTVVPMAVDGTREVTITLRVPESLKDQWTALVASTHLESAALLGVMVDLYKVKGPKGVYPTKRAEVRAAESKATPKAETPAEVKAA